MPGSYLNILLERLDLLPNKAVYFSIERTPHSPQFTLEIESKLKLIQPDAFYSFNSQPYILFFDLSNQDDLLREDEIHKQVWSFDSVPVIFIIKKTEIYVYNAFSYQKNINRLERLMIDGNEIVERFSFWNLQSGRTWTWLQIEKYNEGTNRMRVNQRLFDNIKASRSQLEKTGLSPSEANTTILRLIFIRYLIDRGVRIKNEFITGVSISEKRKSLSDLIQNPIKLSNFFEYLNDRFNGSLFKQKSSFRLTKEQSAFLSQIFDIRKDKISPTIFESYFFDVFDFSIIPVEVISGIYESVIEEDTRDKDSAIYTPPFIVEYMLSETIDKFFRINKTTVCRILDPACGSGIFLVQAFRRMVDEELRLNKNAGLESGRLREIAENNLFGIDLNEQALLVASFSIYIAILDYKEPKEINRFKFPNLIGKNLFVANFFDTSHEYNEVLGKIDFHFIVGNPPWKSKKDDKVHTAYIKKNKLIVGRYEIAQTFLLRTASFMSSSTCSALIVSSTIFYNISGTSKAFKNNFLTNYSIDIFFDLSAVRRLVFESATSPASIVFYRKSTKNESLNNIVHHHSVKSNIFLKHFSTLVLEKFDRKEILQKHFIENDWMFKVALYGNTLDFRFLKRLQEDKTKLLDIIDGQSIYKGAGIKSNKGNSFAGYLIGLPVIENSEVKDFFTPVTKENKILKKEDVYFERIRRPELFQGSKILIKEQARHESDLVISYLPDNGIYKNGIWGIVSKNEEQLKLIYGHLVTALYTYYIYITSCSWGVATRPQVRFDEELLSFPYREIGDDRKSAFIEMVNQFLSPFREYYNNLIRSPQLPISSKYFAQLNDEINRLYSISRIEKDLMDYTLSVSRYQFQESKQNQYLKPVNNDEAVLKDYAEIFFSEFEGLYNGEYLQAEVYPLNSFIAINFKMVLEKPLSHDQVTIVNDITEESKVLAILSDTLTVWSLTDSRDKEKNIYIQKDIKGFEKNSFYIIKPNEYKSWHRAMAWYDVAEIKARIEKAEVETLNEYQ